MPQGIPTPTFPSSSDTGPQNDQAVSVAAQDHICDRSGFKVKAGELRQEWNGGMVRPQDYESRHPLDFQRAKPERMKKGSPRPEQEDVFIETEVLPGDL